MRVKVSVLLYGRLWKKRASERAECFEMSVQRRMKETKRIDRISNEDVGTREKENRTYDPEEKQKLDGGYITGENEY